VRESGRERAGGRERIEGGMDWTTDLVTRTFNCEKNMMTKMRNLPHSPRGSREEEQEEKANEEDTSRKRGGEKKRTGKNSGITREGP